MSEYLRDLQIANSANKKNIVEIADTLSIKKENLIIIDDALKFVEERLS